MTKYIFDITSVLVGSVGVYSIVLEQYLLGVGLVLFGVASFGWSCFVKISGDKEK